MSEIIELLRILGPRNAVRLKRRYDQALPHVRGYVATQCLWAVANCGLADRLLVQGGVGVDVAEFAAEKGLDRHVLESVLSYLDGLRLVRFEAGRALLLENGRRLLQDTRGLFELTYAYEPLLARLDDLLTGRAVQGRDVARRIEYVGRGSGLLCRDLPYPVMTEIIARHGVRRVLDLGCGDLAFLFFLCARIPVVSAVGVDIDPRMVAYGRSLLKDNPLSGRIEVLEGDLLNLDPLLSEGRLAGVDCVTAVDTFHEYLWDGEQIVLDALAKLRGQFPQALFVIGEFCNQPHEQLRKRPTAFLEHHLFHDLTNQRICLLYTSPSPRDS